jgi:hypothetical protein
LAQCERKLGLIRTQGGGEPKSAGRYRRDNPNRRIRARAAPNGAGVNGPGGARVISATHPSAAIASQNVSQNQSI